jgi:hypothetical protein
MSDVSLRIEPMTIRGRYFLFARNPPVVMIIDSLTALATKLITECSDQLSARDEFVSQLLTKGMSVSDASARFNDCVEILQDAGLNNLSARTMDA